MESFSVKLVAILFTSGIFWGAGLIGQKTLNSKRIHKNQYQNNKWIWILGLNPKKDQAYLRYTFLQLLGLIYLIVGIYVALKFNQTIFDNITALTLALFFIYAITIIIIDFFKKK